MSHEQELLSMTILSASIHDVQSPGGTGKTQSVTASIKA